MNESEARAELIDPALQAAGWVVFEESRIRRVYTITLGRIHGHGIYAIEMAFGRSGHRPSPRPPKRPRPLWKAP
jgi:hypothetical protein